jgi:sortase (surface protein transpeptidase)
MNMKKCSAVMIIAMGLAHTASAQFQNPCESDITCYYKKEAEKADLEKQKDRDEREAYHNQELQLQEEQLESINSQTEVIEEQQAKPEELSPQASQD